MRTNMNKKTSSEQMETQSMKLLRDCGIRLLAFDADDTLWDCQGHFNEVEDNYCRLLSGYGDTQEIAASLFSTEMSNMALLGYGSKAFTISLVENAIKVSGGKVDCDTLTRIIDLGKSLLNLPATPLPGVEQTLKTLRDGGRYKMIVFTKGDNLDQENKFKRSGLSRFFDDCIVVADKTAHEYEHLCQLFDVRIDQLCMVGNSFKSDILPVLHLGGYAIHVPYALQWQMEKAEESGCFPRLVRAESFSDIADTL